MRDGTTTQYGTVDSATDGTIDGTVDGTVDGTADTNVSDKWDGIGDVDCTLDDTAFGFISIALTITWWDNTMWFY